MKVPLTKWSPWPTCCPGCCVDPTPPTDANSVDTTADADADLAAAAANMLSLTESGRANAPSLRQISLLISDLGLMPAEIIREIVKNINHVPTLRALSEVCAPVAALLCSDATIWQLVARHEYDCDFPDGSLTLQQLRLLVEVRQDIADNKQFAFRGGMPARDGMTLELMRALLVGSYATRNADGTHVTASLNVKLLTRLAKERGFFERGLLPRHQTTRTRLYAAMAICLSGLRFQSREPGAFVFQEVQYLAHAPPPRRPLFEGPDLLDVNLEQVLQTINFWVFHLGMEALPIGHRYQKLPARERIKMWDAPIRAGEVQMGTRYLGEFAFRQTAFANVGAAAARALNLADEFRGDAHGEHEPFQSLELAWADAEPDGPAPFWPELFERQLHGFRSLPDAAMRAALAADWARLQRPATPLPAPLGLAAWPALTPPWAPAVAGGSRYFRAAGSDHGEPYVAHGRVAPLPAQEGVPGFQRFTMVKFMPHWWYYGDPGVPAWPAGLPPGGPAAREARARAEMDGMHDHFWAYEGVVAPGGQLVVGRYVCLGETAFAGQGLGLRRDGSLPVTEEEIAQAEAECVGMDWGPFVFWCVDP